VTAPDLFDTHAHLHFPEFAGDFDAVLERARAAGVRRILTIGTDVPTSRAAAEMAARLPDVWAAVGIHPHEAAEADDAALRRDRRLPAAPRSSRSARPASISFALWRRATPRSARSAASSRSRAESESPCSSIVVTRTKTRCA
jgi:TatD DNase family protein